MSDFITECNEYKVPEQDFVGAWCSRCRREDCVRSSQGASRFDVRTKTWQERLFTKVPKLPETDPRFPGIAAKIFQETDKTVQAHGWDAPPPPEPPQVESPPPAPVSVGQYTRAPNQSGRVLGTAPAGWTPKEAVIRPGTRIKLGGGGVGEGSDGSKA